MRLLIKSCLVVLMALSSHCLASGESPSPFSFAAIENEGGIESFASFDVDSDGDIDIVGVVPLLDGVRVYRNVGQGLFLADQMVHPVENPGLMRVADVDGDGHLDCVLLGVGNQIHVLLNDGAGVFGAVIVSPAAIITGDFVIGDLDGDGDLDLANVNAQSWSVHLFINDGNGVFEPSTVIGCGRFPTAIDLGDVDGDGDLDIAVSNDTSPASFNDDHANILINLGGGVFEPCVEYLVGDKPRDIELIDLSGDGLLDLVVLTDDGLFRRDGLGDGTFSDFRYQRFDLDPVNFVFHDIDRDGDFDVVVSSGIYNGDVSVWYNDGEGRFPQSTLERRWGMTRVHWAEHGVADYDEDGDADIAMVADGFVYIYPQVYQGSTNPVDFARPISVSSGSGMTLKASGDFNEDGFLEFGAADIGGHVIKIFTTNSDGFVASPVASMDLGSSVNSIGIDDFNNDGLVDFATATRDAEKVFEVYVGDGLGGFSLLNSQEQFGILGDQFVKDFDNDGDSDILLCSYIITSKPYRTVVLTMRNDGSGAFTRTGLYRFEGVIFGDIVGCFDLNLDGNEDLLVFDPYKNELLVRYGEGGGIFGEDVEVFASFEWGVINLIIEDLDGDSQPEIVAVFDDDVGAPTFRMLRFDQGKYLPFDIDLGLGNLGGMSAGDLDQDGRMELFLGRVVYKFSESLELEPWFTLPKYVRHQAVDLDQDGDMDLLGIYGFGVLEAGDWSLPSCLVDLNGDGRLNFIDVSQFILTGVDLNGDQSFNFLDISLFLQLYIQGCP